MPLPGIREADQIARALNGVRAVVAWLRARGIQKERILELLDAAEEQNRDVSEGEIMEVLDATDARIEEIRERAEAEEAAAAKKAAAPAKK